MQANAEPDLAQTGDRLKPVMADLVSGILDLFLPLMEAGSSSAQVKRARALGHSFYDKCHVICASMGE